MNVRLIAEDDVMEILCKYVRDSKQKTIVYEITKLPGCLATEKQALEILGSKEIEFED